MEEAGEAPPAQRAGSSVHGALWFRAEGSVPAPVYTGPCGLGTGGQRADSSVHSALWFRAEGSAVQSEALGPGVSQHALFVSLRMEGPPTELVYTTWAVARSLSRLTRSLSHSGMWHGNLLR